MAKKTEIMFWYFLWTSEYLSSEIPNEGWCFVHLCSLLECRKDLLQKLHAKFHIRQLIDGVVRAGKMSSQQNTQNRIQEYELQVCTVHTFLLFNTVT